MQTFDYERPTSVEQAVASLAKDGARPLAGGTDLIPQMREGRRTVRSVVDLKHVSELTAVTRLPDGGWRLGGAASVATIAANAAVAVDHPGIVEAARLIGSLQVQSRASLGGNLANAAPSADAVPLLVSLGGRAEIAGPQGRRTVPIETVPAGPGRTTLADGELIVALLLPARAPRSAARYLRFTPRREMDIAIAGSGVAIALDAAGNVERAGITLASVAPVPLRARQAEARLLGRRADPELLTEVARAAAGEATPISDTRGSADYRRHLVAVLTRRALEACIAEIEGQEAAR